MKFLYRANAIAVCIAWLCAATVSADPMVVNGDFETDAAGFTTWPGYVGDGTNPADISGWTGMGGRGINPVLVVDGDPAPFRDNGNNDTHVAFLQGDSNIEQTISDFVVGGDYVLSLDFNARNCCGDPPAMPRGIVTLNGSVIADSIDTFPPDGGVVPVGGTEDWYHVDLPFTADTDTIALHVTASPAAGGDATFLVDNIQIVPEPSAGVLTLPGFAMLMLRRRRK